MTKPRKNIKLCTGHYSKQQRLDQQRQENELKLSRELLIPPPYLSATAQGIFKRLVGQAAKADLLDNLDLDLLADYCANCGNFEYAVADINARGALINGRQNPSIRLASMAHKAMIQCSRALGISSIDRLRLVTPTKQPRHVNKFLELLKRD